MPSYIMVKNGERVAASSDAARDDLLDAGYVVETDSEVDPRDIEQSDLQELSTRVNALAAVVNTEKETLALTPLAADPAGPNAVGEVYVTTAGVVRVCTVAGSPGTWVNVGAQV